jgi:SNF2 family DNA or RNA helicase
MNNSNKSYSGNKYSSSNNIITCKIRNSKKFYSGASGFISSKYDTKVISIIRCAPERFWHANTKEWEVALTYLDSTINSLKANGYTVDITDERSVDSKYGVYAPIPAIDIPADYKFKTKAWGKFQLEGVKHGINNDKFLLLDEQGLGKSWQALQIACIRKKLKGYKHCLIIYCVNSNKYNWMEEIEKHTFEKGYLLGTRYRKKTGKAYIDSNEEKLKDITNMNDCFFQITNVETLRYSEKIKVKKRNGIEKTETIFPIVNKLVELINSGDIGYIICDEIHKCKDSNSQIGKALLELSKCDNVGMSGTILMNSPVDLYTPLKFIQAETHSLTQFKQHYCVFGGFGGHQIISYKNLGELQTLLSNHMIRRLKSEELNLPPKIDIVKYVELDKDQQAIYDEIKEDTINNIEEYLNRRNNIDKVSTNMTPLSMLIRLRQATGNPSILTSKSVSNAKFNMLKELVEELNATHQKFIVFSNWTSVLNDAFKLLADLGLNPALYTGQNVKEREAEKQRFKTDDKCRCICGTIDAMGTGNTLTEATTVIFLDEPWTKANKNQAEDRAHRIGTTSSINIITLIAKDTIDERIHDIVYKKGKMSDIIVDKELDAVANEDMVRYLLS